MTSTIERFNSDHVLKLSLLKSNLIIKWRDALNNNEIDKKLFYGNKIIVIDKQIITMRNAIWNYKRYQEPLNVS